MTEDFDHHIARLQTAARDRMPSEQRPSRRRWPFGVAAGLAVAGVIGVAVGLSSGGTASTAEPVATTTTPKPVACDPGQHQSTPEAYYDCVNGAWVRGTAPTTTTTAPPATVPPTSPPATDPPTTEAPTTVPPTTQPVETTTPPPPAGPAPTINITCPTPKNGGPIRCGPTSATTSTPRRQRSCAGGSSTAMVAATPPTTRPRLARRCSGTTTARPGPSPSPRGSRMRSGVGPATRVSSRGGSRRHRPDNRRPHNRMPAPQPEIVPDPPYLFRQTADGEPIRWRACLSMHWRYNPIGEPSPAAIDVVRAAVAQISAASGIAMIEDGVTSIDVSDHVRRLPRSPRARSSSGLRHQAVRRSSRSVPTKIICPPTSTPTPLSGAVLGRNRRERTSREDQWRSTVTPP